MLTEFDELVKRRSELETWWKLKDTVAAYDQNHYLFRCVLNIHALDFCGQQYAGAKNYHEAPKFFFDCVAEEAQRAAFNISHNAYVKEIERINKRLLELKQQVLETLNNINT